MVYVLRSIFLLIFAEPFKVSNVTPSLVSPAQNIHLIVSGISCQDWLQYFVRFQTANGTKKTQQGICRDSVISCYVPEFSPNTRLRVGLTLSNRLVEWADRKILIQCEQSLMSRHRQGRLESHSSSTTPIHPPLFIFVTSVLSADTFHSNC